MDHLTGRIGLVSDTHGNCEALAKAIHLLRRRGAAKLFHLGDAVGYLPGLAAWKLLTAEGVICLKGNHEAMLLGETPVAEHHESAYRLGEARAMLDDDTATALGTLPPMMRFRTKTRSVLLVHGSPDRPLEGYLYPDAALEAVQRTDFDVCFMGHTHRPFIGEHDGRSFINVGSCGQPRDHGSLGSACLFDAETGVVTILRFDIRHETLAAFSRVGEAGGYPSALLMRRPEDVLVGTVVDD